MSKPANDPPRYLYKYRGIDADSLAMLVSDQVYLSRLDAFNDPFESLNLETEALTQRRGYQHRVDDVAASLRVCSLSEEHRDLLMWGHYAQSHRGFCIRFEFAKAPEISGLLYPVCYAPTIPDDAADENNGLERARRNALVKSDKWSYEREWRILGKLSENVPLDANMNLHYQPAALTAIIFGVRTSTLHKMLIRKLVGDHSVEFLQAVKKEDDFALAIEADEGQ